LSLFPVIRTAPDGSQFEFGNELSIDLPGLPCDAYFSPDNKLYVVLPKPSCLQVYDVSLVQEAGGQNSVCASVLPSEALVKAFQEKCRQYGTYVLTHPNTSAIYGTRTVVGFMVVNCLLDRLQQHHRVLWTVSIQHSNLPRTLLY
jgi:hypothetical protein